ncbi:MAG: hypothetical protein JKY98_05295 [Gammaproteobacteria bacterium]|nr:hypothetical protein [Gammaproteobacteria bacterium]
MRKQNMNAEIARIETQQRELKLSHEKFCLLVGVHRATWQRMRTSRKAIKSTLNAMVFSLRSEAARRDRLANQYGEI